MSVTGINGVMSQPIYATNRAKKGVSDTGFNKQISQNKSGGGITLHWFDSPEGDKPLGAVGDNGKGSISVYKPKKFDPQNPIYKVKMWDADGNMTERMVDVSKVDVRNSDRADMFAYACYLTDSGQYPEAQSTFCRVPGPGGDPAENFSGFFRAEKFNWLESARRFMQMQYDAGNLKGYLDFKKFVDFFE